jgi:hypothetical protein
MFVVFLSCSKNEAELNEAAFCNGSEYQIHLINEHDTLNIIKPISEKLNSKMGWKLPYPIYHFEIADVDDDGCDEILIGVIKKTRFDSTYAKRLFIFKLFDGYIRPKWLGSRLSQPIVDFKTIQHDGTKIISIEKEKNGHFLIGEYEYNQFGLKFLNYLGKDLTENEAYYGFYILN